MNSEIEGKHAGVVPASIARKTKRLIVAATVEVEPWELLNWKRDAPLTDRKRQEVREEIVARYRTRASVIWEEKSGVLLREGWKKRLSREDALLAERIEKAGFEEIQSKTIREIKEILKVPLERVLGFLARVEEQYWSGRKEEEDGLGLNPIGGSRAGETAEAAEEAKEKANAVKALVWTQKIEASDIRFGHAGNHGFHAWLDGKMTGAITQRSTIELMDRILAANAMTAEEEIRDIVEKAALEYGPKNPERRRKTTEIYLSKILAPKGTGLTLQEIADRGSKPEPPKIPSADQRGLSRARSMG